MKSILIIGLVFISQLATANVTSIDTGIFESTSVLKEMKKAAINTPYQWSDYADQLDAERDLQIFREVHGTYEIYFFDYFSAEHYTCGFTVRYNSKKRKAVILEPYMCRIED